jgi:hypothetical protein
MESSPQRIKVALFQQASLYLYKLAKYPERISNITPNIEFIKYSDINFTKF